MITIETAKKNLEQKILALPTVTGIGVILWDGIQYIEVAVANARAKIDLSSMFPQGKWEGFPVKIVIREQSKIL